jgi:hypothetical protein
MLKAPNKMPFDHFKPAMAFHKRRPKMKDDHIACLPTVRFALCLTALHHAHKTKLGSAVLLARFRLASCGSK